LKQSPQGTFILRQKGNDHCLSVHRDPKSADRAQQFTHLMIKPTPAGLSISGKSFEPPCFNIHEVANRLNRNAEVFGFATSPYSGPESIASASASNISPYEAPVGGATPSTSLASSWISPPAEAPYVSLPPPQKAPSPAEAPYAELPPPQTAPSPAAGGGS